MAKQLTRYWRTEAGTRDPLVASALLDALKDSSDIVRFEAATALASIAYSDRQIAAALEKAAASRDLVVAAGGAFFFVRKLLPADRVALLIDALKAHGTQQTATYFVNSGKSELSMAGHMWAHNHGGRFVDSASPEYRLRY